MELGALRPDANNNFVAMAPSHKQHIERAVFLIPVRDILQSMEEDGAYHSPGEVVKYNEKV